MAFPLKILVETGDGEDGYDGYMNQRKLSKVIKSEKKIMKM